MDAPSIKGGVVMTVVTLHRWTFLLKVMSLPNILLVAIGGSGESFIDVYIQAIFLAWMIQICLLLSMPIGAQCTLL